MTKIILLGYMGSGKSTIAEELHRQVKLPYVDLDRKIEEHTQLSIAQIFESKGEIAFRKIEHQIFSDLVHAPEPMIISLGGGTPCYSANHLYLQNSDVISVYLKASIKTILSRLADDLQHRPLLAALPQEELRDYIAKQLFERSYYYNMATHHVDTNGKSPKTLAAQIAQFLT